MAAKKDRFIFLKIKIMFNPQFHGAVFSVIKLASNLFCTMKTKITGGLTKQGWKNHKLLMV